MNLKTGQMRCKGKPAKKSSVVQSVSVVTVNGISAEQNYGQFFLKDV